MNFLYMPGIILSTTLILVGEKDRVHILIWEERQETNKINH